MLLSHHQPFSAFEDGGKKIREAMGDLKIHTWFWGHEHRCAIYKPHMNVQHGRLVGHGGVPAYQFGKQDRPYPEICDYVYRGRFRNGLEWWGNFGFAALELDGEVINVKYIDEHGETYYSEKIV